MRTAGLGHRIPATRRPCARRSRPAPGPSQCTSIGKFLQADKNNKIILLFLDMDRKKGRGFWIWRILHQVFSTCFTIRG
jgi:hypothetical protein